ncbi:hypothetical protein [Massilibacteroides vaginae]|uniref:hypothetical protein n=1 Tax=Massilibacteroides vaginae TaxID=1673718 RepID=UPI000A1CF171|nr:hypothetical protein [Massilibacteroides vaginae]
MATINEIDIRKPVTIRGTRWATREEDIESFGLTTKEDIEAMSQYLGTGHILTGVELKLDIPESALFVQLIRENPELAEMIEDTGNLQCIAEDMDGLELLHADVEINLFISVLKRYSHPLLKKIHDIVNVWDRENKLITFETYRIRKPKQKKNKE